MDSLRTELETLNSSAAAILEYLKGDDVRSKLLGELESAPDHIKKAKTSIFESTTAIQQLVTSPVEYHQQSLIHVCIIFYLTPKRHAKRLSINTLRAYGGYVDSKYRRLFLSMAV
jgi:hypothetical protein